MEAVGKVSWYYCGGCYDGYMGPVIEPQQQEKTKTLKLSKPRLIKFTLTPVIPYPIKGANYQR